MNSERYTELVFMNEYGEIKIVMLSKMTTMFREKSYGNSFEYLNEFECIVSDSLTIAQFDLLIKQEFTTFLGLL